MGFLTPILNGALDGSLVKDPAELAYRGYAFVALNESQK